MTPDLPTERREHAIVARLLDRLGVLWLHPASGEERTRRGARAAAALGVRPGWPDVLILDPPPALTGTRGLAIEIKRRRGGKLSPAQRERLAQLSERGWAIAVSPGAGYAADLLDALGYGGPREYNK